MRQPDRTSAWRAVGSTAILLCLMLLGTGVHASTPMMQEARPVEISATVPQPSMPAATDCMPCTLCYIAPAPSTHGFSGECKEPDEPVWRVHAPPVSDSTCQFDTGGGHARLPARIAYCR